MCDRRGGIRDGACNVTVTSKYIGRDKITSLVLCTAFTCAVTECTVLQRSLVLKVRLTALSLGTRSCWPERRRARGPAATCAPQIVASCIFTIAQCVERNVASRYTATLIPTSCTYFRAMHGVWLVLQTAVAGQTVPLIGPELEIKTRSDWLSASDPPSAYRLPCSWLRVRGLRIRMRAGCVQCGL